MKEHHVKIERTFFEAVEIGSKTFEIRKNDCNYQVGDVLVLWEIDDKDNLTGPAIVKEITYMTQYAQTDNYVVLAINKPDLLTLQRLYSYYKSVLLAEQYDYHTVVTMREREAKQEVDFWAY